jgi:CRISPR-associated protein (TIGR02710 family)
MRRLDIAIKNCFTLVILKEKVMTKALIITVGGSDEPIVQAIKTYKPDFIYFICSKGDIRTGSTYQVDGEDKVCGNQTRESIIKQSGYSKGYEKIELDDPDDFKEVYKKIRETIDKAKQNHNEVISDFTGGTKTMSAVLEMLACFDWDIKLSLVKGPRRDVVRTTSGSIPVIIDDDVNIARVDYMLKIVDIFISKYLYYSACLLLEDLLKKGLPSELQQKIIKQHNICKVFSYWDSFEYNEAYELLKNYASEWQEYFQYLLKLLNKTKSSGYEPVFDLISNAERQAENGFYDNATARLYRALELFVQTRLKTKYNIETSHIEKISENLKNKINLAKYEKYKDERGEIKIGLEKAYELLSDLSDEIGEVYNNYKDELRENIKIRNLSKLAHGDTPIKENDWKKFYDFVLKFIKECCKKINVNFEKIQLPNKI